MTTKTNLFTHFAETSFVCAELRALIKNPDYRTALAHAMKNPTLDESYDFWWKQLDYYLDDVPCYYEIKCAPLYFAAIDFITYFYAAWESRNFFHVRGEIKSKRKEAVIALRKGQAWRDECRRKYNV